jgi:Uma2 family endonuclease
MSSVSVYSDERVWTYSDYILMPESPYFYYEVLEGELKMVAKPILNHQWVARELTRIFTNKIEDKGLGYVLPEVDVLASEKHVVAPDIVIIKKENLHIANVKNIKGIPDMTVEIISLSTRSYDLGEKKDFYERIGIKEYWACDYPKKKVDVFYLKEQKFEAHTFESIVPCRLFDFEINVESILSELPFPFSQNSEQS